MFLYFADVMIQFDCLFDLIEIVFMIHFVVFIDSLYDFVRQQVQMHRYFAKIEFNYFEQRVMLV